MKDPAMWRRSWVWLLLLVLGLTEIAVNPTTAFLISHAKKMWRIVLAG